MVRKKLVAVSKVILMMRRVQDLVPLSFDQHVLCVCISASSITTTHQGKIPMAGDSHHKQLVEVLQESILSIQEQHKYVDSRRFRCSQDRYI